MTDTQEILRKIAALRARLDHAQETGQVATAPATPTEELTAQVRRGAWHGSLIDSALRPLAEDKATLPGNLTARAMRLIHVGRDLLQALRRLADEQALRQPDDGPRAKLHRETSAMLETVLRTVQAFPPSPAAQLRLCEGLEAVLDVVRERLNVLVVACRHHQHQSGRVTHLAGLFRKLTSGQLVRLRDWHALADELWKDACKGAPLRILPAPAKDPYLFAAAHSLNVAQVLARLLLHDSEYQAHLMECLTAALVHDVGMVHMSAELLTQEGPLDDPQRRLIERHTCLGAEMLARAFPAGGLIVEAALDHHERLDGTGYPGGKRDLQVSAFTRLLSVCDVYAARCADRPQRAAQETRTALTDTLLQADQGALDKFQAEKLLRLSFYPVGSVVELSDGAVGLVTATHPGEVGLLNPARPILLILAESKHQPLPVPTLLDLLKEEQRSILRSLPAEERRALLGKTHPELV